jgi:hypothetical protein
MNQLRCRENVVGAGVAAVGKAFDRMENVGSRVASARVPQKVLLARRECQTAKVVPNDPVRVVVVELYS